MNIYYGLTEKESKQEYLCYEKNENYDGKLVHLTLQSLKKLIKEEKLEETIKYYAIIPISNFEIINNIINAKDTVVIKIPFKFKINEVYTL